MFKIPVIGTVHLLQHPVQSWWGVETPPEIVKNLNNKAHPAWSVKPSDRAVTIRVTSISYEMESFV